MKSPILLLLVLFSSTLYAQVSPDEFKFLTEAYNKEYKKLIDARGIDTNSYFQSAYLAQNDPSKITSVLAKYFGEKDSSIAALIYFYYDSSLIIYLADPRQTTRIGSQKISFSELSRLNDNFIASMNIGSEMEDRSPVLRSSRSPAKNESRLNHDSLVKAATELLLPKPELILGYQHLVIVPCLNLGAFPFYMLRPQGSYLVEKLSYSIAPSLIEVEASCRKNVDRLDTKTLGRKNKMEISHPLLVSNPDYPKKNAYLFPDLPGADEEIQHSLKFFEGNYTYLKGRTATKKNILEKFTEFDLLYFATHGISSSTNPLDSCYLVFAGEEDPFFTNREILAYRDSQTKMNLVILSACQTGLGRSMDAGIIGLGRAFQIAGAGHVVMSLWNVDDQATAYLMSRFLIYLQFSTKFYPSEPLRKAILDTKKKFKDPSRWASFALFGVPY